MRFLVRQRIAKSPLITFGAGVGEDREERILNRLVMKESTELFQVLRCCCTCGGIPISEYNPLVDRMRGRL